MKPHCEACSLEKVQYLYSFNSNSLKNTCVPVAGRDHDGPTADVQLVHDPEEVMQPYMDEGPVAAADATAADIDMPDHTANDISMLEEEVEVER